MAWVIVFGLIGLVQSLLALVGTLLIFLLVDYPEYFTKSVTRSQQNWDLSSEPTTESQFFSYSNLPPFDGTAAQGLQRRSIRKIDILTGYSRDPDREIIFCFSVACSLLNAIWAVSSFCLLLLSKSHRSLWQWVLVTLAALVFDFIGGCFFAAKTGKHVALFSENTYNLDESTFQFIKYGYPLILFAVFSRGLATYPLNVLMCYFAYRKTQEFYQEDVKANPPPPPPALFHNGENDIKKPKYTNGSRPEPAAYTNHVFTIDEAQSIKL